MGIGDYSHRRRFDLRLGADLGRERYPTARADRDFRMRRTACGTAINQINALSFETPGQCDRLFDLPAFFVDPQAGALVSDQAIDA